MISAARFHKRFVRANILLVTPPIPNEESAKNPKCSEPNEEGSLNISFHWCKKHMEPYAEAVRSIVAEKNSNVIGLVDVWDAMEKFKENLAISSPTASISIRKDAK